MWFTLRLFGVEIVALGVGPEGGEAAYISHTSGSYEIAPEEPEEVWEEEDRFGFR
jgi:hypothetical protein